MAGLDVPESTTHRRTWRAACGLVAAVSVVVLTVVVGTSAAQAAPGLLVTRHAGPDRYATAAAIAAASHPQGASTVLLASGINFADALAASSLAGVTGAPVLLTGPGDAPDATVDAARALAPGQIIAIGGTARISEASLSQVAVAAGGAGTRRIAGPDRYATAALVAASMPRSELGQVAGMRTALVATGENFPDALAAAPIAAAAHLPLLLTRPGALPEEAGQVMREAGITQVLILGGGASVSAQAETQIAATGASIVRLGGASRGATAATIADWAVTTLGFTTTSVAIARGDDAGEGVDALAIGPMAAQRREAVLLTSSQAEAGGATAGWFSAHAATLSSMDIAGGTSAVGGQIVSRLEAVVAASRTAGDVPPPTSDPIPQPSPSPPPPPPTPKPSAPSPSAPPPTGTAPIPGPVTPPPSKAGTGDLQVTITGLPDRAAAAVALSGPGGYYRWLTTTQKLTDLRAGTYQISAAPVLLPGEATTAYPGADAPATVDIADSTMTRIAINYGNHVNDAAVVVAPAAATTITGVPGDAERTLTLDPARTVPLAVGEVLVMGISAVTPHGVLGRIAGVTSVDGMTRVTLGPATLRDALPYADLRLSIDPDGTTSLQSSGDATSRATVDSLTSATRPQSQVVALGDTRLARSKKSTEAGPQAYWLGSNAELYCGLVSAPEITLVPAVRPVIILNLRWKPFLEPEIEFGGGFEGTFDAGVSVDAGVQCKASTYLRLVTVLVGGFVGPVPIVVEGNVGIELSLSGRSTQPIGLKIHSDIDTVTTGVWADDRWRVTKGSGGVKTSVTPTGLAGFEDAAGRTETLEAAAEPKIQILLYGAVGGELGLEIKDSFAFHDEDPLWTLDRTVSFRGGFIAQVWGPFKISSKFDLIPPATERIAQAASRSGGGPGAGHTPPPTPTPTPTPPPSEPSSRPCDGVPQCQVVDQVDVTGDGNLETISITKQQNDKSLYDVRVSGLHMDYTYTYGPGTSYAGSPYTGSIRGLYRGAANLDGRPGKEFLLFSKFYPDIFFVQAGLPDGLRTYEIFTFQGYGQGGSGTIGSSDYLSELDSESNSQGAKCEAGGDITVYRAEIDDLIDREDTGAGYAEVTEYQWDGGALFPKDGRRPTSRRNLSKEEFENLGPEYKGFICPGLARSPLSQ